jgi:DNA-binding XRE family transcriptional regulator
MDRKTKVHNRHIGESVEDFVKAEKSRDPKFAEEFERLQLARRVRALREAKHMTQGDLAERAGTKQPAIARLESGRVVPRLDLLQKIAAALGMMLEVQFVPDRR